MPTPLSNISGLLAPTRSSVPGLLVSAKCLAEAELLSHTNLHWLDLKDPSKGSLGRPSFDLIDQLLELDIPSPMRISIAGGELAEWEASWNQRFLARLPTKCHVKFGLSKADRFPWIDRLKEVQRHLDSPSQLIPVFYADQETANCPEWMDVIGFASLVGCSYVLVDTHEKSIGNLLHHFSPVEISVKVEEARALGLGVALAGSLGIHELIQLKQAGAMWLGVRGAVCSERDRSSSIDPERLRRVLSLFEDFSHGLRERKL